VPQTPLTLEEILQVDFEEEPLLGDAAVAWLLAVRARQGDRVRRIGVLAPLAENNLEAKPASQRSERGLLGGVASATHSPWIVAQKQQTRSAAKSRLSRLGLWAYHEKVVSRWPRRDRVVWRFDLRRRPY
jgi:hypothetical protein